MTDKQSKALRLAAYYETEPCTARDKETAAELRRLHNVNEKLLAREKRWMELADIEVARCDKLQAINKQLLEALCCVRDMVGHPDNLAFIDAAIAAAKEQA